MKMLRWFFLLLLALPLALHAQTPLGSLFEVNVQRVGSQRLPQAAMNARGDLVVTWVHQRASDRFPSLYARRFAAGGAPATGDVLVTDRALDTEGNAGVVVMDGGAFVVVYPDGESLKARRFAPDGTLQGESVVSENGFPSFALARAGAGFLVAWVSREGTVFVRGFRPAGEPAGPARRVGQGASPSLATSPDGEAVVTWIASQPIPEEPRFAFRYLLAQRFGANGARLGERIVVRARPSEFFGIPKVAKDAEGSFLVLWRELLRGSIEERLYARRFAADGSALGGTLNLDAREQERLEGPELTMARDGSFTVAWANLDFSATVGSNVIVQRFTAEGEPFRSPVQVTRGFGGVTPRLAGDANGNTVVVWVSRDESANGVFARRFSRR